ncbi:hypothetical protein [Promicromonospora sp. NPDC023805]|uniref:phage tail assembly protein T n=1 Tax=Promicromonospora sp. NPDC023805 TaxID=3154696 RepID=UPI0034043555
MRFTDAEMIGMVAYQNLYGPVTPQRLDMVAARLGMDIAAPHMKKGKRPKLKDHLILWSRKVKQKTGRELLGMLKGIQAEYDRQER